MASYENFEKTQSKAVAALEEFKKAVAELPEHHLPDQETQEIVGKREDWTRKMERAEQDEQERRREMVRLRTVNADRLTEAISWLDELKGQKQ